jgi:RNA recognition motif-containing protein
MALQANDVGVKRELDNGATAPPAKRAQPVETVTVMRSVVISGIAPDVKECEICRFCNTFGPIESLSTDEATRQSYVNFVNAHSAAEMLQTCQLKEVYLGQGRVQIGPATPPPDDPALLQHIAAGATRNLFVSNFGTAGLEELQVLFSQYAIVVEMFSKGTYMFVNTANVAGAVHAKTFLDNQSVGGSMLKVQYAKEPQPKHEPNDFPAKYKAPHQPEQPQHQNNQSATRNLHLSGYGPGTTVETLTTLFQSIGIQPINVIVKEHYSFVNTQNVEIAMAAMSTLHGHNVNGGTLKVGYAKDKFQDEAQPQMQAAPMVTYQPITDFSQGYDPNSVVYDPNTGQYLQPIMMAPPQVVPTARPFASASPRHDRSVPSMNLHVVGYGAGTTKEELWELFAPHCNVLNVFLKPSGFAFVNTGDQATATAAKEKLNGTIVNGSAISVNYGKDMAPGGPAVQEVTRNLHVSGFGPGTTAAEIEDLFKPYCTIDKVVMKDKYCFVNSTSIEQATAARQALNGTMHNGGSLVVGVAKDRESHAPAAMAARITPTSPRGVQGSFPSQSQSTRNLHVSGFGPGTTGTQIEDVFRPYCTGLLKVVFKEKYAFVNTSSIAEAEGARNALQGTDVNGGALVIGVAKDRDPHDRPGGKGAVVPRYGSPMVQHEAPQYAMPVGQPMLQQIPQTYGTQTYGTPQMDANIVYQMPPGVQPAQQYPTSQVFSPHL